MGSGHVTHRVGDPQGEGSGSPVARVDEAATGARPTRLLVVDDDPDVRLLIRLEIAHAFPGVEVIEAQDGVAALEVLASVTVGVMILDGLMPRMSAFELVPAMQRAGSPQADIPIIAIDTLPESAWRELDLPEAFVWLPKPFEGQELVDHVRRLTGLDGWSG